ALRHADRGKATGNRAEAALEWISPRGIENSDFDARAPAVHLGEDGIEAISIAPHVWLGPNLRIDRDHVGLSIGLDAVTAEKQKCSRAGFDLGVEAVERRAHRFFGQVLSGVDLEPVSAQFIRQGAGVVGWVFQRRFGVWIGSIANDYRHTRFVLLCTNRESAGRCDEGQEHWNDNARGEVRHGICPRRAANPGSESGAQRLALSAIRALARSARTDFARIAFLLATCKVLMSH